MDRKIEALVVVVVVVAIVGSVLAVSNIHIGNNAGARPGILW